MHFLPYAALHAIKDSTKTGKLKYCDKKLRHEFINKHTSEFILTDGLMGWEPSIILKGEFGRALSLMGELEPFDYSCFASQKL